MIKTISTTPFTDQKMGTAGLRRKSKVVMQQNYIENFIQSIFNIIPNLNEKTFLVGGDGRFYNDIAIQKIIKIAAANNVKKLVIAQNGFISTPAGSVVIRKYGLNGGLILSASHNPGGENGDFGIKYSNETGGQVPGSVTDAIYQQTLSIKEYKICEGNDVDLSQIRDFEYCGMQISIIDAVKDYVEMMQNIFDFSAIKSMFANGFTMRFDAMNAVTGPYAVEIFENILKAPKGSVVNATPMPDFGGLHPDPNLVHAKSLVDFMFSENAADFGAANDGDGDRNMILGKGFFVTPNDSLAIITDNFKLIPYYSKGIYGVAKSAATSTAVARVAKAHNIGYYEVPTGWKYFVNLMDSNRITFCGEESFGTGSSHIREKDGIWAVLFWLNILAATGKTVEEITTDHWKKYGRSYYIRFDFEEVDSAVADKLMADLETKLPSLAQQKYGDFTIKEATPFVYNDPVDNSVTKNGLVIYFTDGSRIVYRLSGTGSSGATIRVYLERFSEFDVLQNPLDMVSPLAKIALEVSEIPERTGKHKADVIT